MPVPAGIFVTGTDTGIGKTIVSACLVHRWSADYWKPVQTGLAEDEADSVTVARLAGAAARIHPPRHEFRAPLSPEAAALLEGRSVALDDFALPASPRPIVVEGAGGVLVPLGGGALMADLMRRLHLPVLLVARSTLGTINHSLLSIEALRARSIAIFGVVLVGPDPAENADAITRHGHVRVLASLPRLAEITPASISAASARFPDRIRALPAA
jgi:malonyl-CoA O-methyltransferase